MAHGKYENRHRRRKRNNSGIGVVVALTALLLILAVLLFAKSCTPQTPDITTADTTESSGTNQTDDSTEDSGTEDPGPKEPYVVSSASVGVTGDLLMHLPVIDAAAIGNGKYDFSENFKYMKKYYERFDFMVANLETTLAGTAMPYHGYPNFNCPDDLIDGLLGAGVDMLLTANNHSYDTYQEGMLRTLKVLEEKGMYALGTRKSKDLPTYMVKDLNGIKIGMVCYTYDTGSTSDGRKSLNGNSPMTKTASELINTFNYSTTDKFYKELKDTLSAMKNEGAEATIVFIHWGNEYELKPTTSQTKIAKELCELGVDVIVGGHPHVVQPFETLTSSTGHTTHCIYSLGNALSNQNRNSLENTTSNAIYTEDGMVFGVEFKKWSDGTVKISSISLLPTWVNKEWRNSKNVYNIIPLDTAVEAWNCYNVSKESRTYDSYKRTMSVVGKGLNETLEDMGLTKVPLTFGN